MKALPWPLLTLPYTIFNSNIIFQNNTLGIIVGVIPMLTSILQNFMPTPQKPLPIVKTALNIINNGGSKSICCVNCCSCCTRRIEETPNTTPHRTRRSASGMPPSGAPPARLTGKTQSTKQLLFSQIKEEMAGVLPLLTQAWNTQLRATQSYVCDWAQAIVCTLTTVVKPLPCQKQGCEHTVHHLLDFIGSIFRQCKRVQEESNNTISFSSLM